MGTKLDALQVLGGTRVGPGRALHCCSCREMGGCCSERRSVRPLEVSGVRCGSGGMQLAVAVKQADVLASAAGRLRCGGGEGYVLCPLPRGRQVLTARALRVAPPTSLQPARQPAPQLPPGCLLAPRPHQQAL